MKVSKESGFIWLGEPVDSIERFNILHLGYFPFHEGTDSFLFIQHKATRAELLNGPRTYKIQSDTIEKIGDRLFSIFIINLYDTVRAQYSKQVIGNTTIKSNSITFKYELLTKKKDSVNQNFIENSMRLLKTISLSKGL